MSTQNVAVAELTAEELATKEMEETELTAEELATKEMEEAEAALKELAIKAAIEEAEAALEHRLSLPRFRDETRLLLALLPDETGPAASVKMIDAMRSKLANLANLAQAYSKVKSVSRVDDNGRVKVGFSAGEKTETVASPITLIAKAALVLAKVRETGIEVSIRREGSLYEQVAQWAGGLTA